VEPLGFTDEAREQSRGGGRRAVRGDQRGTYIPRQYTGGLSGIHPRSQISIMSAAMRRYSLLAIPLTSLFLSLSVALFALLPSAVPLSSFSLAPVVSFSFSPISPEKK